MENKPRAVLDIRIEENGIRTITHNAPTIFNNEASFKKRIGLTEEVASDLLNKLIASNPEEVLKLLKSAQEKEAITKEQQNIIQTIFDRWKQIKDVKDNIEAAKEISTVLIGYAPIIFKILLSRYGSSI